MTRLDDPKPPPPAITDQRHVSSPEFSARRGENAPQSLVVKGQRATPHLTDEPNGEPAYKGLPRCSQS